MLKLSAKCCWISAFNAQGSRGIIVAVQVGAVKIYVAEVEALRKKERQGKTQETIKNWFKPLVPLLIFIFIGLAYYQGKDIVFRFIIEYSSLMDFCP